MKNLFLTTALIIPLGAGIGWAQTATTPDATAPAATTDPAATAPAMPDPAATAPAMPETGSVSSTDAAAAPVAVPADVIRQQAANELRLDWVTGTTVKSTDGENVGSVTDVIVDGDTGALKAVIVGVGGFLGIGEKQIAIDWSKLEVNYDANEITTAITKDEATAAPAYEFREQAAAPAPVADPAGTAGTAAGAAADAAGSAADAAGDAATAAGDATGNAVNAATDAASDAAGAAADAAGDAATAAQDAAGAAVDAAGDAAGNAADAVTGTTPPVTTPPAN